MQIKTIWLFRHVEKDSLYLRITDNVVDIETEIYIILTVFVKM